MGTMEFHLREIANRITVGLFTSGGSPGYPPVVVDRLVLTTREGRDLGGWGFGPTEARIYKALQEAVALEF